MHASSNSGTCHGPDRGAPFRWASPGGDSRAPVHAIVPSDGAGGVAVVLRLGGHTFFFNYGWADRGNEKPVTTDSLFNLASLRKVFEATLLARSVRDGDLGLEERLAKYVSELQGGGDIRRVTLGQVATHTSGLLLPQDHPPWPDWGYTLPEFIPTIADERRRDFDGYIIVRVLEPAIATIVLRIDPIGADDC